MPSRAATAALLIVVLAASAMGCVAGWATGSRDGCSPDLCLRHTATHPCGAAVQAVAGHCGMRAFVQFHFVPFPRFEMTPLRVAGTVTAPRARTIILSSIGSPQTDRGPPNS